MRPFKDYFDMPAALVSARVVDALDAQNGGCRLPKYTFWKDVLMALVEMFKRYPKPTARCLQSSFGRVVK